MLSKKRNISSLGEVVLICSGQSDGGNSSSNNSVVERANSCGFGEVALILLWTKRWRGYQFKRFVLEESE